MHDAMSDDSTGTAAMNAAIEAATDASAEAPAQEALDVGAEQLAAWRTQGVDKRDPARFHRIEALALRSRSYTGDVRRVLDDRLNTLVAEFVRLHGSPAATSSEDTQNSPQTASPLATLTADITQRVGTGERPAPAASRKLRVARSTDRTPPTRETAQQESAASTPQKRPTVTPTPAPLAVTPTVISTDDAFEDLDVLEYFRETWSKLSTDGNLRQSLAQVPENAGPLNSSHLVHRALSLMHDVSPDYLRHFLRHADALSWLEDMETTGVLGNKPAARATTAAKPSRAKAR